jgi:hypothetical protein
MMAKDADTKTGARPKRRRITKRDLAKRDLRLVEKLAAGATIEEIAASEGISMKWARERKASVLASRVLDTPHEFIKLQIRRLSEAMLVSYSAMSLGDLRAVDTGDQGCTRARPLSWIRSALKRAKERAVFARRAAPAARFAGASGDELGGERASRRRGPMRRCPSRGLRERPASFAELRVSDGATAAPLRAGLTG